MSRVFLKDVVKNINLEDIIKYYDVENHTIEESAKFFNISCGMFLGVLNYYNFHKSKDAHIANIKKAKLNKYGDENYNNRQKAESTCIEKYGISNPFKDKEKIKLSYIEAFNTDHPMHDEEIKNKVISKLDYSKITEKRKRTCIDKYGVDNVFKCDEIKDKINKTNTLRYGYNRPLKNDIIKEHSIQTNLNKYGLQWTCMREEARSFNNNSIPNKEFSKLLKSNNINYSREFIIENKSFDFKIGNTLIEINPTATHNSTWGIFGNSLDKNYHYNKTKLANNYNFNCIHIYDWEDKTKIINLLQKREVVFARKCILKDVSIKDCKEYLNKYHLQNYAKDNIRLGLYYNDELVSVMTFGKPRYNKNYDYELIRFCSHKHIIGGAEKLFSYFIKTYMPKSVISYCDNSKFIGKVYTKLGFSLKSYGQPTRHWYNMKTKIHITDNLLRQRGFDQLFGTNYGKGTSNEQLILENNFVEIYDCGQSVYEYNI